MGIPISEFQERLNKSVGMKLIVAGLAGLVDDEGYTFHEALEIERSIENNCFPALMKMERDHRASSSKA
jgi:hypothetical protein